MVYRIKVYKLFDLDSRCEYWSSSIPKRWNISIWGTATAVFDGWPSKTIRGEYITEVNGQRWTLNEALQLKKWRKAHLIDVVEH